MSATGRQQLFAMTIQACLEVLDPINHSPKGAPGFCQQRLLGDLRQEQKFAVPLWHLEPLQSLQKQALFYRFMCLCTETRLVGGGRSLERTLLSYTVSINSLLNSQFTWKLYNLALVKLPYSEIITNFQTLRSMQFESGY